MNEKKNSPLEKEKETYEKGERLLRFSSSLHCWQRGAAAAAQKNEDQPPTHVCE
jgi:hypothetical protein